ncbi:nucleotide kinase domain-containing protein [Candidatus Poriferisodalis sp.]|uniref:nucleotide kinase domain-containing protein n=1 Tax=Candidatus Poriferisodalis sp. TaxID=3101277 RepID=UPI003AF65696
MLNVIGRPYIDSLVSHVPERARLVLGGCRMVVTKVFWSYWYLAAERQAMFMKRTAGEPAPWTTDPILDSYRFTNAYRASDRVSQSLLQDVIYSGSYDCRDTILRVLLFKIFNRAETWQCLVDDVGQPSAATFDRATYTAVLDRQFESDNRLYSGAYIMPAPQLGYERKHANHIALLEQVLGDGTIEAITRASSLHELYRELLTIPSFGSFLAYQYAVDLNYSRHFEFDEMEFVVAGPGALRGIEKCFADTRGLDPADVIRAMADSAEVYLADSPVEFSDLWGRPLQLIDCQNLFCEVDKYARVAHPDIGVGGPYRIKQTFRPDERPLRLGYPPKWGLPWSAEEPVEFGSGAENRKILSYFPTNRCYGVAMPDITEAATLPSTKTPTSEHLDMIRELILSELSRLRIDRNSIESAMGSGSDTRIPSRKAMVVIARVCKSLGVGNVVKKADLTPDQVTNVANLIDLLARRTQSKMAQA